MGLIERVTGFYRRISDKPAQPKPEPKPQARPKLQSKPAPSPATAVRILGSTGTASRSSSSSSRSRSSSSSNNQAKPTRAEIRELSEPERIEIKPKPAKVESESKSGSESKTISDEEFNELIADLPPERREKILKDYEKAKETGGQIKIIEGEAPHATLLVAPTPKDIEREKEREKKMQEDYESLSPAVKMFVDRDDETKNVSKIAENERTLRKQSVLYEAGYQVGKLAEGTSKSVEEKLPLEKAGPVGAGVEKGIAGLAGGIPFLGSVVLQAGGLVEASLKGVRSSVTPQDVGVEIKEMGESEAQRFKDNPLEVGAEYATLAFAPFAPKGLKFLAEKAPVRIPTPVRQTILKGATITEVEAKAKGATSVKEVKAARAIGDNSITDVVGVLKEDPSKITPEINYRKISLTTEKRWKLKGSEGAKDMPKDAKTYATVEKLEFSDVGTKYAVKGIGEVKVTQSGKPSNIGAIPESAADASQALEFAGGKIPDVEVTDIATNPQEFFKLTGVEATPEVLARLKGSKGIIFSEEPRTTARQYRITFERKLARDIFREQGRKAGFEETKTLETVEPGLLDKLKLRKAREVEMEDRMNSGKMKKFDFEEMEMGKGEFTETGRTGSGGSGGSKAELVEKTENKKSNLEHVEEIVLDEKAITDMLPGLGSIEALPVMKSVRSKPIDRHLERTGGGGGVGVGVGKTLLATMDLEKLEKTHTQEMGEFDVIGEATRDKSGVGDLVVPQGMVKQKVIEDTTDIFDIPFTDISEESIPVIPTPGFPFGGGIGVPVFPPIPGSGLEALDYYSDWWKYKERDLTLSGLELLFGGGRNANAKKNSSEDSEDFLL